MKKYSILLIIYILVLSFSISFASSEKKPEAFLPETEFNVNSVSEGAVIEHDFVVENKGTGVLEIYNVSGG